MDPALLHGLACCIALISVYLVRSFVVNRTREKLRKAQREAQMLKAAAQPIAPVATATRAVSPPVAPPKMSGPPLPPLQKAVGVPVEHIPNPYRPFTGTLRIHDPLHDNKAGYGWMDDTLKYSSDTKGCHFEQDKYFIDTEARTHSQMIYCLALQTNFSNFVYQIDATLLAGSEIGVVFRQTPGFRFYYFCVCRNGTFSLYWSEGKEGGILKEGFSSAIKTNLNDTNTLAVVANDMQIELYANQQRLAKVIDGKYKAGRIGTASGNAPSETSKAGFSNLMLWTLD